MRNPYPNFVWFFGTAEDTSSDPLRLGRIRVRAVGFHPSTLEKERLPWAPVLNGGAAKIVNGQMILGFFLDGEEAQQPCVLGTIGGAVTSSPVFDYMRRLGNPFEKIIALIGDDNEPEGEAPPNKPVAPNPLGFMNPLGNANYQLTSDFGPRTAPKFSGGAQGSTNHGGVDMAPRPKGATTSIFAAKDGIVTRAEYSTSYGYVVYIDHGDGVETRYAHMRNTPAVAKGQKVKQGTTLGIVGNTPFGRSTGAHLHYEVRVKGKPIDPEPYLTKKG